MTIAQPIQRRQWRPDSEVGDAIFDAVLQPQFESWLWRGWISKTERGPFPGPGKHPDAGKPFADLDPATLKIVAGNCEAVLGLFEALSPEDLDLMRQIGQGILAEQHLGEQMPPELMLKVARVHHSFWVHNREIAGAQFNWKAPASKGEPGYLDHWGHFTWDHGLPDNAKEADFVQARAHCRTLAALDQETFDQIRAWAARNANI
ncbi:MAG: hypothetical protein J0M12_02460 [Deltaproteobacteria bacterium]|nr:hypothetical protein [Deltaproteobacteria bacterium]